MIIEAVRRRNNSSGGDISDLLKELPEPAEAREVRIKITDLADFKAVGGDVLAKFEAWVRAGAGGDGAWTMEEVRHQIQHNPRNPIPSPQAVESDLRAQRGLWLAALPCLS